MKQQSTDMADPRVRQAIAVAAAYYTFPKPQPGETRARWRERCMTAETAAQQMAECSARCVEFQRLLDIAYHSADNSKLRFGPALPQRKDENADKENETSAGRD